MDVLIFTACITGILFLFSWFIQKIRKTPGKAAREALREKNRIRDEYSNL